MTIAHGEGGELVPAAEFDYDAIDRTVFDFRKPDSDLEQFSAEDLERSVKGMQRLCEWIWQTGMKNPDGVKIRAIICCWVILPELRPLTLTQLARGYGLKKQSIGRWVDDFKRVFPRVQNAHMRKLDK